MLSNVLLNSGNIVALLFSWRAEKQNPENIRSTSLVDFFLKKTELILKEEIESLKEIRNPSIELFFY